MILLIPNSRIDTSKMSMLTADTDRQAVLRLARARNDESRHRKGAFGSMSPSGSFAINVSQRAAEGSRTEKRELLAIQRASETKATDRPKRGFLERHQRGRRARRENDSGKASVPGIS